MQGDRQDSWTDALFWGVTAALGLVAAGSACLAYFNLWLPFAQ